MLSGLDNKTLSRCIMSVLFNLNPSISGRIRCQRCQSCNISVGCCWICHHMIHGYLSCFLICHVGGAGHLPMTPLGSDIFLSQGCTCVSITSLSVYLCLSAGLKATKSIEGYSPSLYTWSGTRQFPILSSKGLT